MSCYLADFGGFDGMYVQHTLKYFVTLLCSITQQYLGKKLNPRSFFNESLTLAVVCMAYYMWLLI